MLYFCGVKHENTTFFDCFTLFFNYMSTTLRRLLPFFLIFAVYCIALPNSVMEIDASQYAHLSMEMLLRGDWLHFLDSGTPYLDKPPLLFWLNGISYTIFGVNEIAYRLPSLLMWCLGVWAVYNFGKRWYNTKVGYGAALIMASSQGAFLMIQDVRCDTLLCAFVAVALWQISIVIHRIHEKVPFSKRIFPVFWSAVALGCAMLSKGPIGAIVPMLAVASYVVLNRQWSLIFKIDWAVMVVLAAIMLMPMLYGLYTQYDMHPELVVNGQKNVSGVWFFLWTQSFGRITGESVWANGLGYDFFFHTILWAFMPWSIVLYIAVYQRFRDLYLFLKDNFFSQNEDALTAKPTYEWLSLGGFVLPFLALSLSHYKLPHYIYVTFPMASILVAVYYRKLVEENLPMFRVLTVLHFFISLFLGIGTVVLCEWAFPKWWAMLLAVIIFILIIYAYYRTEEPMRKLRGVAIGGMLGLNFILNLHIFPTMLTYQSATQAGDYCYKNEIANRLYKDNSSFGALDFSAKRLVKTIGVDDVKNRQKPFYFYTTQETLEELYSKNVTDFTILKTFEEYGVTNLQFKFLNVNTRDSVLAKRYLLQF